MAKVLTVVPGFFYIGELGIPKGVAYHKLVPATDDYDGGVQIYMIEKDSRIVIGNIDVDDAVDGDNGNAPFTYGDLVTWVQDNTRQEVGSGGGGGGTGGDIDTSLLATKANQTNQITRETEIRDNIIALLAKTSADPATQTTLAAILAKIISNPATSDNQTTEIARLQSIIDKLSADPATKASIDAITAKLSADPSTGAKQDTGNASLVAILTKIIAAPATEAKQDAGNTSLSSIDGKTPTVGQKNMAGSQPVTLASDQSPLNVNVGELVKTEAAVADPNNGIIAAANTSQMIQAGVPAGRYVRHQNISANDQWLSTVGPAAVNGVNSFKVTSGGTFEPSDKITNAIYIASATAGDKYSFVTY